MPSVIGICFPRMLGSHTSLHNSVLSFAENAPIYETNSLASKTSPITLLMLACKKTTFSLQRLFSPARPLTNFSAACSLSAHFCASYSTVFFSASAAFNFSLKLSTISFNFLTSSLTLNNYFIATSKSSLALL